MEPRRTKFTLGKLTLAVILTVLISGMGGLGYLYYQTRSELKFLTSLAGQQELAKKEQQQVLGAASRLIILPDEEPVVATITDASILASQSAFYKNAENGDKLLVFQQAKQAFIYSPSKNKLVNVGPILVDGSPVSETSGAVEPIEESTPSVTPKPSSTTQPTTSEINPGSESN